MKQETKKKIAIIGIAAIFGICAITGTTNAIIQKNKKITANAATKEVSETTVVAVIGETQYFQETVTIEQKTYTLQKESGDGANVYIWVTAELDKLTTNGVTIGNLIKEEYSAQDYIYIETIDSTIQQTGRFRSSQNRLEQIATASGGTIRRLSIMYNPQEGAPPTPTTNNITEGLYNLIWNTFFSGTLPEPIQNCAEEICTIMTIGGIALAITLPLIVMFGLIKWIWNFVR